MSDTRTVLLTGATGFIGRHLLGRLRREDVVLHAVCRSGQGPWPDDVVWHKADLLEPGVPAALLSQIRPSHLLHNAWMAIPGRFWTDPQNIDWLHASLGLMAAFTKFGGKHFVGVGTCAEYDWGASTDFLEDETAVRPATLYGKAKAAVWAAAEAYAEAGAFTAGWGRIFLPYGPGDTDGRLLPALIKRLAAGQEFQLGDGSLERDFIFAPDAADLLVCILLDEKSGAFNVATGRATSIAEAVQYVADKLGRRDLLRFNVRHTPINEPRRLVADMTKATETLAWSAPTTLFAGLDETTEFILKGTGFNADPSQHQGTEINASDN